MKQRAVRRAAATTRMRGETAGSYAGAIVGAVLLRPHTSRCVAFARMLRNALAGQHRFLVLFFWRSPLALRRVKPHGIGHALTAGTEIFDRIRDE
jgi:hypothetical protein